MKPHAFRKLAGCLALLSLVECRAVSSRDQATTDKRPADLELRDAQWNWAPDNWRIGPVERVGATRGTFWHFTVVNRSRSTSYEQVGYAVYRGGSFSSYPCERGSLPGVIGPGETREYTVPGCVHLFLGDTPVPEQIRSCGPLVLTGANVASPAGGR